MNASRRTAIAIGIAAGLAAAVATPQPVAAATRSWTGLSGPSNPYWDLAGNWDGGVFPPATGDTALLGAAATSFRSSSGTLTLESVLGTGKLTITGGALNLSAASSIGGLALGDGQGHGTLGGVGAVNVSGASTWGSGTMAGSGSTTFNGNLAVSGGAPFAIGVSGRTLVMNAATTWGTGSRFWTDSAASIKNNASWLDQSSSASEMTNHGGAQSVFVNAGTYTKSGAGATNFGITFNNIRSGAGTGEVRVSAGTLALKADGSSNGYFDIAANAVLAFSGAASSAYTLTDITSGTGQGDLQVSGSTVNANGSNAFAGRLVISGGVLNVAGRFDAGRLAVGDGQGHGTLAGAGAVNISGASTWGSGTMAGSGITTFNGNLAVSAGSPFAIGVSGRTLVMNATTTWGTGSRFWTDSAASIKNNASWLDQSSSASEMTNHGGAQSMFVNAGTYTKSGTGTTTFGIVYVNNGIADVQAGTLALPPNFANAGTLMGNGTVKSTLVTNNGHVAPGDSTGTLTVNGSFAQTAQGSFDVELQSPAAFDSLVVQGSATLGGTLQVICVADCSFAVGQTFKILDANPNALFGGFGALALTGFGAGAFDVIYDRANGDVLLDVINATAPVPEPASAWLLLFGGLSLRVLKGRRATALRRAHRVCRPPK